MSVIPSDNETSVPLSTNQIRITFNQPMNYGNTPGSAGNKGVYSLKRESDNLGIPILNVVYDPGYQTAILTFDNSVVEWVDGEWYYVTVKLFIRNACSTKQGFNVTVRFRTENQPFNINISPPNNDPAGSDIKTPETTLSKVHKKRLTTPEPIRAEIPQNRTNPWKPRVEKTKHENNPILPGSPTPINNPSPGGSRPQVPIITQGPPDMIVPPSGPGEEEE